MMQLDLSDLNSVELFVESFDKKFGKVRAKRHGYNPVYVHVTTGELHSLQTPVVDGLINNAGVTGSPEYKTSPQVRLRRSCHKDCFDIFVYSMQTL